MIYYWAWMDGGTFLLWIIIFRNIILWLMTRLFQKVFIFSPRPIYHSCARNDNSLSFLHILWVLLNVFSSFFSLLFLLLHVLFSVNAALEGKKEFAFAICWSCTKTCAFCTLTNSNNFVKYANCRAKLLSAFYRYDWDEARSIACLNGFIQCAAAIIEKFKLQAWMQGFLYLSRLFDEVWNETIFRKLYLNFHQKFRIS